MAVDPYEICPCGSGKKIKFCCIAITGEMSRVERLIQGNQIRQAKQTLDALDIEHPGNPWIGVNRVAILLEAGEAVEATEILKPLVESHPEHLQAIALLASASFSAEGFDQAKPAIHRAFQVCAVALPDMIGNLALGIAAAMYATHKYMATRQHLTLAMRLVSDEKKQDIFLRLLEFDGNRRLPFPLRSVHELEAVSGSEELEKEATKARRLSGRGCWRPAAKILSRLAEQESENAALWLNAGLCHAWDGDEVQAAKSLYQAARFVEDNELAIEYETLAQLLDYNTTEDVTKYSNRKFTVSSVSRLLTALDENNSFVRMELPQEPQEGEIPPAAMFHIVDRPELLEKSDKPISLETIANVISQVTIYDANPDQPEIPAMAFLSGEEGDTLEAACKVFLECGEDLATAEDPGEDIFSETIPRELSQLTWRWQLPDKTPVVIQRGLELQKWKQATLENWTETPLAALDGKTPAAASSDTDLKMSLAAAVVVLDSYCDRVKFTLDIVALREQLQSEQLSSIEVTEETSLNSFTVMQLQRLPIEALSDAQLSSALNRAILIHHGRFLKRVLVEVLKRPVCLERVDMNRVHMTLLDLCLEQGNREEALEWVARGFEHAQTEEKSFENSLQWSIRELSVRLEDPSDTGVQALLERMDRDYNSKIPELRNSLEQQLAMHDITPPWEGRTELAGVETDSGNVSDGCVWTPGSTPPAEGDSEKKLWTPGQD